LIRPENALSSGTSEIFQTPMGDNLFIPLKINVVTVDMALEHIIYYLCSKI
jgi:hypothetical protein